MKKYFLLALVVLTGIASSCKYDDDEVWDSVNDLADRVTALEAATKQLNSDIAALQSIVSALQKQVSVSKVETLADGYILHFSDGTKATIKNGEDGKDGVNAPVINVAKENGKYYWTITMDGETEWLTDEAGNKLAVSGKDGSTGADGKTPVLGVDAQGYWTIDGKRVKDASGNDLKAKGENGDSQFKGITSNEDGYIVITMADGTTTYKLPLLAAVKYKQGETEVAADGLIIEENTPLTLTYDVSQLGEKYSVEVLTQNGITVKVNENKKELTVTTATGFDVATAKAVILYYNGNQTITSVLSFVQVVSDKTALENALNKDVPEIKIQLTGNMTYDVAAWQNNAMGGTNTERIIIDGNGKTITFNQTNSDWNNIVTNGAKLVIKNAKITNSGHNDGPWNRHDLNFGCEVELIDVTSDKAIALKAGGTLTNVTINDDNTSDTYAIWIQPNGQTVTLDGCTIDMLACSDGRGIKIDEQYVTTPAKVTLNVSNTTFKTEEKSAILVKSVAGADITLSEVNITEVAADQINAVWVDEASASYADWVTVTGGTKIVEP